MKKDMGTINEIIKVIGQSELTEICIEEKGFKLFIKKPKLVLAPKTNEIEEEVEELEVKAEEVKLEEIKLETVGRFYSVDKEGNPMLDLGMKIKEGQKLGYVEAIGIKTDIISKINGTVKEILTHNGEIAEYGKVIVKIAK